MFPREHFDTFGVWPRQPTTFGPSGTRGMSHVYVTHVVTYMSHVYVTHVVTYMSRPTHDYELQERLYS